MQFFIDTADLDEIRSASELGVLDGVTTNPSLIAKVAGKGTFTWQDFKNHIAMICEIVDGPVSAEVSALDAAGMIAEGEELADIHENVVIKCPVTLDGLRAIRYFSEQNILTNATLIFSMSQALLAAKAGASYLSPFVGRLDDISTNGMGLIADIMMMLNNYSYDAEVIVASIRNPMHVVEAARLGADVATIPYGVIKQLLNHPLTDSGLRKFSEDAALIKK